MTAKQWVVFDMMGVIFKDSDTIRSISHPLLKKKIKEIDIKDVYKHYYKASVGRMRSKTFWKNVGAGHLYPGIENEYVGKWFKIEKDVYASLKKLGSRYKLGILSNDVKEWSRKIRKKYGLNRYFSRIVISGDVKAKKPDKKIFEIFLKKAKTEAGNCYFIDDKSRNLVIASGMGFKTIKFDRGVDSVEFTPDHTVKSFKKLVKILL